MNRRKYLLATGVTLPTILAGCAGGADDENGDDDPNGDDPDSNGSGEEPEGDEPQPDDDPGDGDDTEDEEEDDDDPPRSDADTLMSITETLGSDEPLFDPGVETFTGNGDSVTDEFNLSSVLTVVTFDFDDAGMENYQLELEGPTDDLVVNTLDGVTGAAAIPTEAGDYLFDVTAPSGWEVNAGQPLTPDEEIRTPGVTAEGEGPDVVGPLELEGGVTVSGEHNGEGNFMVHIYDEDDSGFAGELVFNEIGEFDGETRADYPGICWIDVEADGEWTLEIE